MSSSMAEKPVTIKCRNHYETMVSGLWNSLKTNHGTDFNIQLGEQVVGAHRHILELFLMPENLFPSADRVSTNGNAGRNLERLLEFLYKGEVTVARGQLDDLLEVARDSCFEMLVEAVESVIEVDVKPDTSTLLQIGQPCSIDADDEQLNMTSESDEDVDNPKDVDFSEDIDISEDVDISDDESLPSSSFQVPKIKVEISESPSFDEPGVIGSCLLPTADDPIELDDEESASRESAGASAQSVADKNKSLKCHYCSKTFPRFSHIKKHYRSVHPKERPFTCDFCAMSFSRMDNLNRHRATHNKERPFTCTLCDKSFKVRQSLTVHMWIHSEEKSYSCDICSRQFLHPRYLKRHKLLKHHISAHRKIDN